jgi:hypothetical protein
MPDKIIHLRSLTPGSVPTTSSLGVGQIAINVPDGKAFLRQSGSQGDTIQSFVTTNSTTTGSINISGSVTLTGSLNISGSTTQIGNNNLLGNTTLSGSIIISGSTIDPTVQIYGNVEHNGYIRFDPVSTNINTSISASYIYVSGSTNDLYFSQNGSGFNNVTRLRWLEGNLYTGLLNGGNLTATGTTTYQISSGSGVIVNLNASLTNNPFPTIQYINWGNLSGTITAPTTYDQSFVAISSSGQIYAQGTPFTDGQVDTYIPIGVVLHQNHTTINGVATQPSVAYGWKQRSNVFISAFGPLKLAGYTLAVSSSGGVNSTGSLIVGNGTAFLDGGNYQTDPNNPAYVTGSGATQTKIFRYYDSGSEFAYDTANGAGYGAIDPTQYSNNGVLTLVPGAGSNRQWSIQRCFFFPTSPLSPKPIVVYYGNATYTTQADAIANISIEPFTEAPNTAANAIYLGALIVRNDANFTNSATYKIVPGGLFRSVGGSGGGTTVTNTLAGLSDVSLGTLSYGDLLMYDSTHWYNTKTLSGSYTLSGSLNATEGITGSILGTASYATYAANGGVTQLLAGSGISLAPTNGLGQVTITSTGGGSGVYGNTATGSYGSFYSTQTQTVGIANNPYSMSFNNTEVANGVAISGSENTKIKITNPGWYDLQFSAQLNKSGVGAGVVNFYIWLRKNGINLAATNTIVQQQGGANSRTVAAWNWFLNAAANDYYEIMWAADATDAILEYVAAPTNGPSIPSVIATVSRIDQFLSNTGSFTGSFTGELIGTASYATNGLSSSYSISSSYSLSSSYALSSSYSISSSYSVSSSQAVSSSFATTASYVLQSVSASFSSTASFVNTLNQNVLITGSLTIASSSIGPNENTVTLGARDTAGEGGQIGFNAPGGIYTSASMLDNYQNRFRILKGTNNGSTEEVASWNLHTKQMVLNGYTSTTSFPGTAAATLAVDSSGNVITTTGGGGASFPYTGSAVITGSLIVTGSATFTDSILYDAILMTSSIVTTAGGNTTILTQATGSYRAMFAKYTVLNALNARAGEFMMVWTGSSFQFTDTSTVDIGSTAAVALTGSLSGANVLLTTAPGSGWTVKVQTTYI